MSGVAPWVKRAIWLLVIYGMLYVLISPLPEMAATFSGKSPLIFIIPIACSLFDVLFFALLRRLCFAGPGGRARLNVLELICLRLC
jgi:hypothetical protein